jgi:arylsulfatase A-like enzyme
LKLTLALTASQTWGHTPTKRGFQSYTGYLQGQGDYYKHNFALSTVFGPRVEALDGFDFWHNTRPFIEAKGNYSLDLYRDAVSAVLKGYVSRQNSKEKQAEHPLFVYLAHQTVHIPLEARKSESRCNGISHPIRRTYCCMMVELDDAIQEMVDEYKNLGLWEDLLILTMTDNGGMVNYAPNSESGKPEGAGSQGSNYPLRGSKTSMFDGGVRSMAFVAGGYIPKEGRGRRVTDLVHVVDFTATVLTAAGVLPLQREQLKVDGHSLMGLIVNSPGATSLRDHVPINIVLDGQRYSAVRFGKHKLILDDFLIPAAHGWFDENGDLKEQSPNVSSKILLFDLEDDPQERTDISAENPHLVAYGKDILQSYILGGNYMEPQESVSIHPRALPVFHGGVWKPFMTEATWTEKYEESRVKQHKKRDSKKNEMTSQQNVEEEGDDEASWTRLATLLAGDAQVPAS